MTTTTRFNMAMSALIGAFFTNTLVKGICTACAIGNIVAKANGISIKKVLEDGHIDATGQARMFQKGVDAGIVKTAMDNASWRHLFFTGTEIGQEEASQKLHLTVASQKASIEAGGQNQDHFNAAYLAIAPTGYSAQELSEIESAYEMATKIRFDQYPKHTQEEIKEDQYNGLMAVTDVLCALDGNADEAPEFRKAFEYSTTPQLHAVNPEFQDILEYAN